MKNLTTTYFNYLIDNKAESAVPMFFAEVLDDLIWLTPDSGHEIMHMVESWMQGTDLFKVQVGLFMKERFPFGTRKDMELAFERLKVIWPELTEMCNELMKERNRLEGNGPADLYIQA